MILEELIHKRFVSSESLIKQLAQYDGVPAVFSTEAPDSKQDGWGGNTQYPRVVYNFDLQANEERKSAGTLSVSLYCQNTEEMIPEVIEPEVRQCLKDILLYTDDGKLYAFAWNRTDAFELKDKKVGLLIGSDIRFDILEYTNQETTDPDPIMATNQYIKKLYPDCIVIGLDRMQEITEATADQPVIYCRLVSADKAEETNTVAWMDGKIAVHILCPDSEVRMKIGAAIAQKMSLDGEIVMLDYSPMSIKRLQANYKSDYLKDGQIFVTGRYGILRYKSKPKTVRKVNIEY